MASFVGWALRRSDEPSAPSMNESIDSTPSSSTTVYTPSAPPLPSSSSSSYYPSVTPSAPSESAIEAMRAENNRLRAVLEMIKKNKKEEGGKREGENIDGYSFEHLGSVPGANGFLLSIPSAPPALSSSSTLANDALWTPLPPGSKPIPTNPFVLPSSSSSSSICSSSVPPSSISSSSSTMNNKEGEVLLTPDDASTVIVKSEAEGEVALLDLSEIDWYVMVNNDGSTSDNSSSSSSCGKVRAKVDRRGKYSGSADDKIVESEMLGESDDGYLLIDHEDYIVALSDFISRSIQKKFPEAEQIPPEQLRKILGSAFKPLQPPSRFGKAIGWANFLYHSYSWGTTAFTIYREGVYAKLVLRGAMKAAQWLLVLVL